jgi:predicted adenylyl cyclase CyaB
MGGTGDQEIEVKFFLKNINQFENQIIQGGGKLIRSRSYEINYRFDTKDHQLRKENKILRLRKDDSSLLTYKGPTTIQDGIRIREELEIPIEDIQLATRILESIGFKIDQIYEKYRAIYSYKSILIMIDNLPIGNFVEFEGENPVMIKSIVQELGINWNRNIQFGYLQIYQQLCNKMGIKAGNLVFEDQFSTEGDLEFIGIFPADKGK